MRVSDEYFEVGAVYDYMVGIFHSAHPLDQWG